MKIYKYPFNGWEWKHADSHCTTQLQIRHTASDKELDDYTNLCSYRFSHIWYSISAYLLIWAFLIQFFTWHCIQLQYLFSFTPPGYHAHLYKHNVVATCQYNFPCRPWSLLINNLTLIIMILMPLAYMWIMCTRSKFCKMVSSSCWKTKFLANKCIFCLLFQQWFNKIGFISHRFSNNKFMLDAMHSAVMHTIDSATKTCFTVVINVHTC